MAAVLKALGPDEWLPARKILERGKIEFSKILTSNTPEKSVSGMLRTSANKRQWFVSKKVGRYSIHWQMTDKGRRHDFTP